MRSRKEKIATGNRTEREFKMRGREQDKGRRRKKETRDVLQSREGRP